MYTQRGYSEIHSIEDCPPAWLVPEIVSLQEDGTLSLKVLARGPGGALCYALVAEDASEKIGVSCVRKLVEMCEQQNVHTVTLVSNSVTPFTRKELSESQWRNTIQFFKPGELAVNVTRNFLVPEHVLVSADEVVALVKTYGELCDWPRLPQSDRISRHYDYRPGDVIRIDRVWLDHREIAYRVVH